MTVMMIIIIIKIIIIRTVTMTIIIKMIINFIFIAKRFCVSERKYHRLV